MFDGKAFGAEIVGIVKDYVEQRLDPIKAENESLKVRIAELEARPTPEKGEAGEKGMDGESGKDADPEAVRQIVAEEVAKAVAEIPPAEKGEKGDTGEPGQDGKDGERGESGKDGCGIKDLLIDRTGSLVCTLDDGRVKELGPVVGKDGIDGEKGEPGKDGRDGFSLESFDVEPGKDGRTYILKFSGNGVRHDYELTFPVPVYCGVFKQGDEYFPGDIVTWGGSAWHCDKETTDKPGTENWRLMVKKGRDGKDKT